ncbi:hypothetical protein PAERUG_E5_London_17_VIM_2_12_12_04692 [Pseudomonas aeruginosa]|nr:hypothetical protein PAERUG_E5_London_17_VIM_2_12_12_04692 [Pseudomonas aeruginosa]
MGMFAQSGQAQPVLGTVAVGASAQAEVDHLLRLQGRFQLQAVARGEGPRQADEDLPVVQRTLGTRQHGLVETGHVTHGEDVEGGVVVIVLQRRGGRQDEIGVAGRLVDVEVDAEHELQAVQGLFEPPPVGRGQHRVAGYRDQRAHLPLAFTEDFFRQCRHRQFAAIFRQPRDAAAPTAEVATRGTRHQVQGRRGAQRATDPVEVAGDQVDQLHQPLAERAEGLGGNAHPAIADRPFGGGEIPRQLANAFGRHATARAHGLGVEDRDRLAHPLQPVDRQRRGATEVLLEQGVEYPEQQRRILAGTNEQVPVGDSRGLAAPGIDHHQPAAACLQRLQALLHVRHGHDAAVGRQRVAAEHQHEVGVVDVGDRDQQTMAVHLLADQVMRQLVDGSRGEAVARFQQAEEVVAMGHQAVVVHARIALVDRHRIVAMALADLAEAAGHQREGLVPADRLPLAADPAQRLAQAVGVVLDVLQGHRLGTDMAAAEAVLRVALDRADPRHAALVALGLDGEPADGLAEMARTVVEGLAHGSPLHCRRRPSRPGAYARTRRPV